jgi:hypothetical protein
MALNRFIAIPAQPGHVVLTYSLRHGSATTPKVSGPVVAWLVDPRNPETLDAEDDAHHAALFLDEEGGYLSSTARSDTLHKVVPVDKIGVELTRLEVALENRHRRRAARLEGQRHER